MPCKRARAHITYSMHSLPICSLLSIKMSHHILTVQLRREFATSTFCYYVYAQSSYLCSWLPLQIPFSSMLGKNIISTAQTSILYMTCPFFKALLLNPGGFQIPPERRLVTSSRQTATTTRTMLGTALGCSLCFPAHVGILFCKPEISPLKQTGLQFKRAQSVLQ